MKTAISILFILTSLFAQAQTATETQISANANLNKEEKAIDNNPKWVFLIGKSNYDTSSRTKYFSIEADGILLGVERNLGEKFALGLSYTNYRVNQMNYSVLDRDTQNVTSAYLSATPIQISVSSVSFSASAQLGFMTSSSTQMSSNGSFIGAAMNISVGNQIGLRLDAKNMNEYGQMVAGVSLLGYY